RRGHARRARYVAQARPRGDREGQRRAHGRQGRRSRAVLHVPPLGRASARRSRRCTVKRPIRVVVAKAGLDGHDRGAKVVARALRDAGMEVIYTGVHQTPEQVVETALQEDADAIGLSLLSGAHNYIFPRVSELMKEKGLDDVLLFGGGIIPEADWAPLSKVDVEKVFPPGASLEEITKYVREAVPPKRGAVAWRSSHKKRGITMATKEERPVDAGLAALVGKSEQELIDFWKQRFTLIAAIPMDTARVGALTPQLRELVR